MNAHEARLVVVGTDGRPGSDGALRYGVAEALRRHAPLRIVHVVQLPAVVTAYPPIGPAAPAPVTEPGAEGESVLRRAIEVVRRLAPELEVSTELKHGGRVRCLVEAAQRAELLVVGRETRRGLDRMLGGATTAAVASRAECDVVVVPSFWTEEHAHGEVVAAVKSRGHAPELLRRAFAEASARRAALTVVTAWAVADPYLDRIELRTHAADWRADGEAMLGELLADWRTAYPDVPVETLVAHGSAADVILAASQESDLVLISRRRLSVPPSGHLGGVAHAVLRRSDVPVAVVPFEGPQDELTPDLVLEQSGQPLK